MTTSTWLDEDADGESLEENAARGGFLSELGRAAAIRTALPLVGRYFQSRGSPDRLRTSPALARSHETVSVDDRLLAGLRLRAALAVAEHVLAKLEAVVRRPTFRYTLNQRESIGELQGTLDLSRYLSRPPIGGGPPTYPILDVRRSSDTPENVMCAYAALWMNDELQQALDASDASAGSPESSVTAELVDRFSILLTAPAFREGITSARETLWLGAEDQLLNRVEERLRRGEVGNPEPYQDLLNELRDLQHRGPTGGAGEEPWTFYDDAFDTRLYELWCLYRVGQAVSEALAVDMPPVQEYWNGGGLTFRWSRPVGTLELYYQRSLSTVSESTMPRWIRSTGATLRGIPDLIARAVTPAGGERFALLDAKLRQRSGPPTEELYKVLGYFNNFGLNSAPRGGILHHAPAQNEPLVYQYEDASSCGVLIATALNPSNEAQSAGGLRPVAEMIVGLLGISPPKADRRPCEAEAVVEQRLAELEAIAVTTAPTSLDASKRRLQATLGDKCWSTLSDGVKKMLATAEHVGFILGDDADFSGPVLGLLAPIESLLHSLIVEPAKADSPGVPGFQKNLTFGASIDMLLNAIDGTKGAASDAIRRVLKRNHAHFPVLRHTLETLSSLNINYRVPAAHKEALNKNHWIDVHSLVILGRTPGEMLFGRPLICRVLDQLRPPAEADQDLIS